MNRRDDADDEDDDEVIDDAAVDADVDAAVADRPSPRSARLAAAVIDFTGIVVVVLPILLIWTANDNDDAAGNRAANWLALGLIAAYPIVSIALWDQTQGKRVCGLRVHRPDGSSVGWPRSVVRFLVAYSPLWIGGIVLRAYPDGAAHTVTEYLQVFGLLLVYAPIVVDEQRRGLHDRVAGTVVTCRLPPLLTAPALRLPPDLVSRNGFGNGNGSGPQPTPRPTPKPRPED